MYEHESWINVNLKCSRLCFSIATCVNQKTYFIDPLSSYFERDNTFWCKTWNRLGTQTYWVQLFREEGRNKLQLYRFRIFFMSYLVNPCMTTFYNQRWGETKTQHILGQKPHRISIWRTYDITIVELLVIEYIK